MEQQPLSDRELFAPDDGTKPKICKTCERYMAPWTKHCYWCDKCIDDYDHHCRWLNHCVGARNYSFFAVFVSNTLSVCFLQWCLGVYYIVEMCRDWNGFSARCDQAYGTTTVHGVRTVAVFVWFACLLEMVVVIMLGHLWTLHVYLVWTRRTTYMWILEERDLSTKRKMERRAAGVPDWENSPTCHALTMIRHQKDQPRDLTLDPNEASHPGSAYEAGQQDGGLRAGDLRRAAGDYGDTPGATQDEYSDEEGEFEEDGDERASAAMQHDLPPPATDGSFDKGSERPVVDAEA